MLDGRVLLGHGIAQLLSHFISTATPLEVSDQAEDRIAFGVEHVGHSVVVADEGLVGMAFQGFDELVQPDDPVVQIENIASYTLSVR